MEKIASCCQSTFAMLAYDVTWCSDLIPPISQTGLPPEGGFELQVQWRPVWHSVSLLTVEKVNCIQCSFVSLDSIKIKDLNNFELLAGIMFLPCLPSWCVTMLTFANEHWRQSTAGAGGKVIRSAGVTFFFSPDCGARWKVEGSWSYFNLSSGGHKLLNQILWQSIQ